MDNIIFTINENRIITSNKDYLLVGDNTDYVAEFIFPPEWDGNTKTAIFEMKDDFEERILKDDRCFIPARILKNGYMRVGVFTATMATTHVSIRVLASIKDKYNTAPPYPNIYEQILALIDELSKGEISEEQIDAAVSKYLQEHPLEESDPTVPAWAKAENPPTYTAEDVGARPSDWMPSAKDVGAMPADTKFPDKLPNPHELSINIGGTVVEYDGTGAVTVTIPDADIIRVEKTAADTVVELEPNKLYIFPEMTTLTYTLAAGKEGVANEYHFIFKSGATPTEVVHPEGVNVGSLTVEANKIYEISVMENCLTSQSWAVTT